MDMFLLGPEPEIENDSQTNKCVLFVKYVTKALLNFLSWCYQKVKECSCSQLTICFAVFIIIMLFVTPTMFFGGLYKLDYRYCKNGSYEFNITAKDIRCEGWFEFRSLNLIKYFPIVLIYTRAVSKWNFKLGHPR